MKILYVPNCGFGDVSWSTSWPRIFTEKDHEIDVLLMQYTGNPFHANPFIKNMFVVDKMEAAERIRPIINNHSYDLVLIPKRLGCAGVSEVIEATKNFKNVRVFDQKSVQQIIKVPSDSLDLEIPPMTKPEWHFMNQELKYIKDSKFNNSVLFHPISSCIYEKSRNIDFDLIIECAKELEGAVVVHGGRSYLPKDTLEKIERANVRLLWENYNCFSDNCSHALGKILALTSQCQVSIHGWSGSMCMSMGYNKPYVVVVPGYSIRGNQSVPYIDTKKLYDQMISRAKAYNCLNPSAWCITDKAKDIIDAIDYVCAGKTGVFDKTWTFI